MASGGSYIIKGNERVLNERSGHNLDLKSHLEKSATAAKAEKVKADENKKESVTGRG